jgi:hypothetical protein
VWGNCKKVVKRKEEEVVKGIGITRILRERQKGFLIWKQKL